MIVVGKGRVSCASSSPTIVAGIVSRSGAQVVIQIQPAPDDHFAARPDCRVKEPGLGREGGGGRCPTVRVGVVSAASVECHRRGPERATPDDHFAARPDCRVKVSGGGRVGCSRRHPTVRSRIVSAAGIEKIRSPDATAPHDHFTASPHRCMLPSGFRRVAHGGHRPTIRAGIVSPATVQKAAITISTPNDHFTAGPHRRVTGSGFRRVSSASGYPTIRAGTVSAAGGRVAVLIASC